MDQKDRQSEDQAQAEQVHKSATPLTRGVQGDADWVADVKRWYFERARGIDVVKRQEVQKGLQ